MVAAIHCFWGEDTIKLLRYLDVLLSQVHRYTENNNNNITTVHINGILHNKNFNRRNKGTYLLS